MTQTVRSTILIVDDNAITRKVVRVTLVDAGYRVREAQDGESALAEVAREPPDLILQDLLLPDCNGIDLVGRLRALPGVSTMPILAFSGFRPAAERARQLAGFTDYIYKPVEPSALVRIIAAYLPPRVPSATESNSHRSVLVADDDPIQLKLTALQLTRAGHKVTTVTDGLAAFEAAVRDLPDLVVSDILMPGLDGFRLCADLGADPRTTTIPVILQTAAFSEAADRTLAQSIGAADYIVRTPDCLELLAAVTLCLATSPTPRVEPPVPRHVDDYTHRLIRQLERLASVNLRLSSQVGWLESERAMLGGLAQALRGSPTNDMLVDELLYRFVDAAGISFGLAYLAQPDGALAPGCRIGLTGVPEDMIETFFGQSALLDDVVRQGIAMILPSETVPADQTLAILTGLGAVSAIIVPLGTRHESVGVITLGSEHQRFDEDWRTFSEAVGVVIGQSIGLARAVAQLRASEERFRRIVETTPEGIWMIDAEDRTTYVNQQLADLLGYGVHEMIGRSLFDFMSTESGELARTGFQRRRAGQDGQLEFRFQRKDGSQVETWLNTNPMLAGDKTYEGAVVTMTDITSRKNLEVQLQQAQKMEAIGQLAGGVAHDFNNLLTVINGYGELLVDRTELTPHQLDIVGQIRHAGESAAGLTRQLLAFSRQQIAVPRELDLNETVEKLSKMLRRIIGEDIALSVVLAPNLGVIQADPGQIEQILLNLVTNARDAMPRGGRLSIETANIEFDAPTASRHPATNPGPYVLFSVSDSGVGMDTALLARIFEPFFTTKDIGKGTGLGLAAVQGIISQNGGAIDVTSAVGVGTTFRVFFPRGESSAASQGEASEALRPRPGTETILVVEDDARLRALSRITLEGNGYRVLEADDGEAALAFVATHSGPIHLLLTDVVMPRLGGRQLAEQLSERYPAMKVLFVSGYTDDVVVRHGVVNATVEFLQKPFSLHALIDKVRQVLDSAQILD